MPLVAFCSSAQNAVDTQQWPTLNEAKDLKAPEPQPVPVQPGISDAAQIEGMFEDS